MKDTNSNTWKILIVDDEPEMHRVTLMVLDHYVFESRKLEFLSALSFDDAKALMKENPDIAIVLLDVIMEEETSGLKFVRYIRDELKNRFVRIILRTGQAARIPESKVVLEYDINDFKAKSELTYQKLFTSITSALRSYLTIITLERSARDLEKEKELLAATIHSIEDAVIAVDNKGFITLMNDVAERISGCSKLESIGKSVDEVAVFLSRKDRLPVRSPVRTVLERRRAIISTDPVFLVSRDGTERLVNFTCSPIIDNVNSLLGAVIVARDETHRILLEDEVVKVQKLESIGILAGGIAHDFNNILTGILGKISLAKIESDPSAKCRMHMADAEKAVIRAQSLTRQLLTFSIGNAPLKEPTTVRDIIDDSATISLAGTRVKADISISDDISNLFADTGQISQVIGNIVINGVQAMPSGGTLRITAGNVIIGEDNVPNLAPGHYVQINISDTGEGIPEDNIPRIFDPFFTTRSNGNGLGLTTSHTILRQHGGTVTVHSKVGKGSTFSVFLPSYEQPVEIKTENREPVRSGKRSILLMDDDEIILSTIMEIFSYLGYEGETARDGKEAIEKYKKRLQEKKPFDIVIMDLTVPGGMGGREAIKLLRAIDPKVRALVSSGYSNDPVMAEYERFGFNGLIAKPYKIEDLADAIHKALNGK